MKATVLFAAVFAVPTIMGAPLSGTTHHTESIISTSTPSKPGSPLLNIDTALSKALVMLLGERSESPNATATVSELEPRQYGPPHVYYPPPGEEWSDRTQCVITASGMHLPIWRTLVLCGIRHNGKPSGNTRIYELCAEEAAEEGISEKDKYMRCKRFKGFGR